LHHWVITYFIIIIIIKTIIRTTTATAATFTMPIMTAKKKNESEVSNVIDFY